MSGANIDWLRFLPFMSVALIVWGWALIEQFSDRPWNIAKVTIVLTGYSVVIYIGSLALNYSWLSIDWPNGYYDWVRVFMGFTVFGIPFVWRNVWWSIRAWLDRRRDR